MLTNIPAKNIQSVEINLKQSVQDLHLALFNHPLEYLVCWPIADNMVVIILEASTTQPEQVLLASKRNQVASAFRQQLNAVFERHLKLLFTNVYQCPVSDVLSQHQPETGRMSLMVTLNQNNLRSA